MEKKKKQFYNFNKIDKKKKQQFKIGGVNNGVRISEIRLKV